MRRIAIFNSDKFHYEMFGYIIYHCTQQNYSIDIFYNSTNAGDWNDFYLNLFKESKLRFLQFSIDKATRDLTNFVLFRSTINSYDTIFLTTDDDEYFKHDWLPPSERAKIICIDHHYTNRRDSIPMSHHIATRPFSKNLRKWALPCYPILQSYQKKDTEVINIAIVGKGEIVTKILKRLKADKPIYVHYINYKCHEIECENLQIIQHENVTTTDMIKILSLCNYLLSDATSNSDHRNGYSMSASVPLSFSTLCNLIICKENNNLYKFKTAVEYEYDAEVPIYLNSKVSYNQIAEERDILINMFKVHIDDLNNDLFKIKPSPMRHDMNGILNDTFRFFGIQHKIPKRIFQTFETKTFSEKFQTIVDSWKIHNPHYTYIIHDSKEREEFIKDFFDPRILQAYKRIIPGAYKADFWRCCVLYIYGGIYVDIDTICLGNIDSFLNDEIEFMAPIDLNEGHLGYYNISNGFIASVPKSPILMDCIKRIVRNVETNTIPPSKLDFSGPGVLGRSLNTYLGNKETESFIGKEGIFKNIHFLKFEPITEYVKDKQNNILLQNKNGNKEIVKLYDEETRKAKSIWWVTAKKIIE